MSDEKSTEVATIARSHPHNAIPHQLLLGALLVIILATFSYTVAIRRQWFGVLSMDHHQWLTASTMKFSTYWYHDGAARLGFRMLENPPSVEFPTIESRGMYASYPPGTILPIYAISKITRQEPNAPMIMAYNLANQLLIAIVLAFTVYLLMIRFMHRLHAVLLAAIPPLFVLLLPAPLYWFQNVYFSDQAIILPFALLLLTEVLQDVELSAKQRRWVMLAQALILFFGFFTDWLFVFIGVVVYAKRLIVGQIPLRWPVFFARSLTFWVGPLLALGLFSWQLTAFHAWGALLGKYLERSGTNEIGKKYVEHFFAQFWQGHVGHGYGAPAIYLLGGSLFISCTFIIYVWWAKNLPAPQRKAAIALLSIISICILPCFIEIYTLKNHSWVHDFSALKMLIPLSLVPLVLLPVICLLPTRLVRFRNDARQYRFQPRLLLINIILLSVALSYTLFAHQPWRQFFPQPDERFPRVAQSFRGAFSYSDIIVTRRPGLEIPANPPQLLAFSQKRVYLITSQQDIDELTKRIRTPFKVIVYEDRKK